MASEHFDVLIVGAGVSGIGAAHHVLKNHPQRSVAVVEMRENLGGTWDFFKYPGVRSDSDMLTLGYSFRPWKENTRLAGGAEILSYLKDTAKATGVDKLIRYNRRVVAASWSTETSLWTAQIENSETGETEEITTGFLLGTTGYYRYDEGYTPHFEGREDFSGPIVHPHFWPEDLDYAGKRIVVIGSGATALTLIPELAGKAEHVTMLQRSAQYVASLPTEDPFTRRIRRVLPDAIALPIARWRNVLMQIGIYQLAQRRPEEVKKALRKAQIKQLPAGYDVDAHFSPADNPWDQRLCAVADGDLFASISAGDATIVTDTIERFTENGVLLKSGDELPADIIITATGLTLLMFGDMKLSVDGEAVSVPDSMAYKSLMLAGVPNFAFALGYTNASWTLKADLTGEYVCRLLSHMDATGTTKCVPVGDPTVKPEPLLTFTAGYVQRSVASLPSQGDKTPWRVRQNYAFDRVALMYGKVDDGTMAFSRPVAKSEPTTAAAATVAAG